MVLLFEQGFYDNEADPDAMEDFVISEFQSLLINGLM